MNVKEIPKRADFARYSRSIEVLCLLHLAQRRGPRQVKLLIHKLLLR